MGRLPEPPAAKNPAIDQTTISAATQGISPASLLDAVGQAIIASDLAGRITYWNRAAESLYGLSAAEAHGRLLMEVSSPELPPHQAERVLHFLCSGEAWQGAFPVQRRDGSRFVAWVSYRPVYDTERRVVGIVGTALDLTESQQLSATLAQRGRELRALIDTSPLAIVTLDSAARVRGWNRAAERVFGWREEEVLGRPYPLADEEMAEEFWRHMGTVMEEPMLGREIHRRRKDGSFVDLALYATAYFEPAAGEMRITAFLADIGARKKVESDLRQSESRFRTVFERSPIGIALVDAHGCISETNQALRSFLGCGSKDLAGQSLVELVHPDERASEPLILQGRRDASEEVGGAMELRLRRGDGSFVWGRLAASDPPPGPDVSVSTILMVEDIDAERRIEEALRVSRERESILARSIHDAVWDWDPSRGEIWWSNGLTTIFGQSPADLAEPAARWQLIHPEDRSRVVASMESFVESRRNSWQDEYRLRRGDGSYAFVLDRAYAQRDSRGALQRVIGALLDLSERKRAEVALKESEERYRLLLDLSPDGVFVHAEDVILYVNPAAEALLGEGATNGVVGKRFSLLVHPEEREQLVTLERRFQELGGQRRQEIYRYRRPNGDQVVFEVSSAPLTFRGREARLAIVRDVSERERMAVEVEHSREALRRLTAHLQSVREREQTRIAHEIHDELGQGLTALKLDLAWLRKRLIGPFAEVEPLQVRQKLEGMSEVLERTLGGARRLAHELRPPVLDDLGLAAALEWLVAEFRQRVSFECGLEVRLGEEELSGELATAVYRIVQEALTNVTRHAEATEVMVRLLRDGDSISLLVSDDGKGFVPVAVGARSTLGHLSMSERARALGGELAVESVSGSGTTVRARIPFLPAEPEERIS